MSRIYELTFNTTSFNSIVDLPETLASQCGNVLEISTFNSIVDLHTVERLCNKTYRRSFNSIVDLPHDISQQPCYAAHDFQFYSRSSEGPVCWAFKQDPRYLSILQQIFRDVLLVTVMELEIFQFYSRSSFHCWAEIRDAPSLSFNSIVDLHEVQLHGQRQLFIFTFNSIVDLHISQTDKGYPGSQESFNSIVDLLCKELPEMMICAFSTLLFQFYSRSSWVCKRCRTFKTDDFQFYSRSSRSETQKDLKLYMLYSFNSIVDLPGTINLWCQ